MTDRSPDQVWWPRDLYTTHLEHERDRLKAENARLREALERIMRCTDDCCAEDVARAALKGTDK